MHPVHIPCVRSVLNSAKPWGVGAWLSLLTWRPSQHHGAPRASTSGDDDHGRTHAEQGDAEVQDQAPVRNWAAYEDSEGMTKSGAAGSVVLHPIRIPNPTDRSVTSRELRVLTCEGS